MRLLDAAKYFDKSPVYDGYTGAYLWDSQFSSFNDSDAVGSTSTRRVLSIAPGLVMPARRVLLIENSRWVVGDGNPDLWGAEVIRQSYNMKKASDLGNIVLPGQACLAQTGTLAYFQKIYFAEQPDLTNTSDTSISWNLFFAPSEVVLSGYIVQSGTEYYRAVESYIPVEGLRVVKVRRLDSGPQPVTFLGTTFNPMTDSYSGGSVAAQALVVPATMLFRNEDATSPIPGKGDLSVLVAKSQVPTVSVGSQLQYNGTNYRILAAKAELDAWMVHARDA